MTATIRQIYRGPTSIAASVILPDGALMIDEDLHAIRVHDGLTEGGYPIGIGPALLSLAMSELLDTLPTDPPSGSKLWWNNSGTFTRTP